MNAVLDDILVGLALLASAIYAVSSLGPRTLRRRITSAFSRAAARLPAAFGLASIAGRMAASAAKAGGACGGCDGCGGDAHAAGDGGAPGGAPKAEVSIPLAKIGRRG